MSLWSCQSRPKKKKDPSKLKGIWGFFSHPNHTVETPHLGDLPHLWGEKHFLGTLGEPEPNSHTPASAEAEPRVSQRDLFPLTALVSAKSACEVGSSSNSGKQRGDLLRGKPQSRATLSTAARGAPATWFRAPLSAANASLPHVCFRLDQGGFLRALTFQLLIFLLGVLLTRS